MTPRPGTRRDAPLGGLLVASALLALSLAACSPAPRPVTGDMVATNYQTAFGSSPTTTVPSPFWCPRRASP